MGEPLPSVRTLARSVGVSPATASSALASLRRRGLVVTWPRSGTVVSERPPLRARGPAAVPTGARDLASGSPDPALLPDLAAALGRVHPPGWLYAESPVLDELAAAACADLARDGIPASRVAVVNGALDGIERVLAARLMPGDALAIEDPGWPSVFDVARAVGLRLTPVAVDAGGMLPSSLAAAVRGGARGVVLTPRGQNPTGAALDAARASELRAVLADAPGVLVLEDDHLGPAAGAPWHSVGAGRDAWAVVRSTSKWLGPDLRVAVLAGDELTVSRVEGRQSLGPGWGSGLSQALA